MLLSTGKKTKSGKVWGPQGVGDYQSEKSGPCLHPNGSLDVAALWLDVEGRRAEIRSLRTRARAGKDYCQILGQHLLWANFLCQCANLVEILQILLLRRK